MNLNLIFPVVWNIFCGWWLQWIIFFLKQKSTFAYQWLQYFTFVCIQCGKWCISYGPVCKSIFIVHLTCALLEISLSLTSQPFSLEMSGIATHFLFIWYNVNAWLWLKSHLQRTGRFACATEGYVDLLVVD